MKGTSPFQASPEVKETPITSKLWSRQSKGTKEKNSFPLVFGQKTKLGNRESGRRRHSRLYTGITNEIIQMSERERDRPVDNSIGSSHINLDSFFASFSRRFVFPVSRAAFFVLSFHLINDRSLTDQQCPAAKIGPQPVSRFRRSINVAGEIWILNTCWQKKERWSVSVSGLFQVLP